jgi:phospholipid/cholesterol/gamma-HCH transport system substrate-binding protein
MRRLAVIALALVAAAAVVVVKTVPSRGAGGPYLVRAIFDDAGFAVPGEDVRISGAPVGSIQSLAVTPDNKAAVTLAIDNGDFTPWYANATCTIRPQSLIAERYVDCEPGSSNQPPLAKITSGAGAGQYLLPVTRTSSPIDFDIVQNISQLPVRQRLAIIINEFGTGLAAQGANLNTVIHRANPSLGYTDQVLKILAAQNRQLAQLATDSNAVLGPLALARQHLQGFVVGANTTAVASAARASDISRSIQLFPTFLRQLDPLLISLGKFADQGTPLLAELQRSAAAVGQQFENLTPFAKAARPALIALGKSAHESQAPLVASIPLAHQLENLGEQALPTAEVLNRLLGSLYNTGGFDQLMAVLFLGTAATNGFDSDGHYARVQPLVGDCTGYAVAPIGGCSANFGSGGAAADTASVVDDIATQAVHKTKAKRPKETLKGLMDYLVKN